jgi:hypothetical protein
VHREALANALAAADKQVRDAIELRDMDKKRPVLRIAVFHHAIHGPGAMQNLDFVSNLQTAGVKFCLHGDVHELRRQWIDHWDEYRNLHVIGAGGAIAPVPRVSAIFRWIWPVTRLESATSGRGSLEC